MTLSAQAREESGLRFLMLLGFAEIVFSMFILKLGRKLSLRRTLHLALWLVVLFLWTCPETVRSASASPAVRPAPAQTQTHALLRDTAFRRGFILLEPELGQRVPRQTLRGFKPEQTPLWDLAQWSSRFPALPASPWRSSDGTLWWTNVAKQVGLGAARGGTRREAFDLALGVNGSVEYARGARRAGQPWVHLLVEQHADDPPALDRLVSLRFHIEARLTRFYHPPAAPADPRIHAAQFQAFLTVQNRNRQSPDFNRLLWFGIPIYDNRARQPRGHAARDTGTGMFIYTPAGSVFTHQSAHDGHWITIDRDVLPLIKKGLHTAWQRGFLIQSRQLADYRITSLNLGWEVPGVYDVLMQVRGLRLVARVTAAGSRSDQPGQKTSE